MKKKKLTEVWVCTDKVGGDLVIFPSTSRPRMKYGYWDVTKKDVSQKPLKDITLAHFKRTYGAENTPPRGKKWLMDIEL